MLGQEWKSVRRVVAARLDNIGDVLLLSPALQAIKDNLPGVHLTLMASPGGGKAASLLPTVDEVMPRRVIWQNVGGTMPLDAQQEFQLIADVRHGHFDAAIIFTSFSQSPYPPAFVFAQAGVSLRLGQSKETAPGLLTTHVKPKPDDLHQAERNLHLLESLGFRVSKRELAIQIPQWARSSLAEKLQLRGIGPEDPFILIHPGASCQARRYPWPKYAGVQRLIAGKTGLPTVISGDEREVEMVNQVCQLGGPGAIPLAGETSLEEFAALVERARLVICNDTATMHFADATGTAAVILYSGTEYESQWRPRWAPHRLLRRPTGCSPCYLFACARQLECLDFEPEEVVQVAQELLNEVSPG